jgi:hypothetical protein
MSNDLICPECGGVIGGDSSDRGHACTCFANQATARVEVEVKPPEEPGSSGDTFVDKPAAPAKACCQCGKDVTGKKRFHDSRGYWCEECHKADKAAHAPKGVKCAGCGRVVAEAGLFDYDGERICGSCRSERQREARERRRLSPVKTSAHHEMDKRRLLWLLAIVAVLVLIIILRQLKLIGS